jgi:hypothetical protein
MSWFSPSPAPPATPVDAFFDNVTAMPLEHRIAGFVGVFIIFTTFARAWAERAFGDEIIQGGVRWSSGLASAAQCCIFYPLMALCFVAARGETSWLLAPIDDLEPRVRAFAELYAAALICHWIRDYFVAPRPIFLLHHCVCILSVVNAFCSGSPGCGAYLLAVTILELGSTFYNFHRIWSGSRVCRWGHFLGMIYSNLHGGWWAYVYLSHSVHVWQKAVGYSATVVMCVMRQDHANSAFRHGLGKGAPAIGGSLVASNAFSASPTADAKKKAA